jgi:dihydrodiol dehydrogenase / D-xylose 1-dehydrogenase (NADP)
LATARATAKQQLKLNIHNCFTPPKNTTMAPLRWGIASAGRISNDFCTALTTLSENDHKVVAVAARSESSAKEFADTFNIPKYYGGYEALAQDPDVGMSY